MRPKTCQKNRVFHDSSADCATVTLGEIKPETLSDLRWEWIKEIENLVLKLHDVENQGRQNQSLALEIAEDRVQILSMKEKLEKQLRFIHELLLDPTAIDRVENYKDMFASGNWENLQKIARTLKKLKR